VIGQDKLLPKVKEVKLTFIESSDYGDLFENDPGFTPPTTLPVLPVVQLGGKMPAGNSGTHG
jgi:hypothetical protein